MKIGVLLCGHVLNKFKNFKSVYPTIWSKFVHSRSLVLVFHFHKPKILVESFWPRMDKANPTCSQLKHPYPTCTVFVLCLVHVHASSIAIMRQRQHCLQGHCHSTFRILHFLCLFLNYGIILLLEHTKDMKSFPMRTWRPICRIWGKYLSEKKDA